MCTQILLLQKKCVPTAIDCLSVYCHCNASVWECVCLLLVAGVCMRDKEIFFGGKLSVDHRPSSVSDVYSSGLLVTNIYFVLSVCHTRSRSC